MHTYSFFIHHAGSETPELNFEFANGETALRPLAEKALNDSADHVAIEVREEDRLIFSLDRS